MLKRPALPVSAFLLILAMGSGLTVLVHRHETATRMADLERGLDDTIENIENKVAQISAVLIATRAYVATRSAGIIPRERFAVYHDNLAGSGILEGGHGIGLALVVHPGEETVIESRIQQDYGPDRKIWPEALPGVDLRSAIVLLEPPDDRNLAAIGYDMYSDPLRRSAMRLTRQSGQPAMTGPVTLVQEISNDPQPGTLIYVHVPGNPKGEAEGFIYAPLRMGQFFTAPSRWLHPYVTIRVHDSEAPDQPLYADANHAAAEAAGRPVMRRTVSVAGRQWAFEARDIRASGILGDTPLSILTALAVLVLSVAIAIAVQSVAAVHRHTLELAQMQARSLRDKDLFLQEMKHRLKNVLARVIAIARQSGKQADTKEALVASLTGRLQAMANAQDLLTRSAEAGTALACLIRAELDQIQGGESGRLTMEGPEVRLDAREVQCLGLVFHEMATNALKYGMGSGSGGDLVINWQVDRTGLTLVWDERTGQALTPPERPGFGSRLIDSCIRVELGGTVDRDFHDGGLTITIRLPRKRRPGL